jgi:hypothetical protein
VLVFLADAIIQRSVNVAGIELKVIVAPLVGVEVAIDS